ncbi:MAG: hypothetical protein KBD63_05700 [Bacteriovoracaceae bacterium]|nr:hypothetical protein [Bacteriovoracaceae bacterium]
MKNILILGLFFLLISCQKKDGDIQGKQDTVFCQQEAQKEVNTYSRSEESSLNLSAQEKKERLEALERMRIDLINRCLQQKGYATTPHL